MRLLLALMLLASGLGTPALAQSEPLVIEGAETFYLRGPSANHPIHVILPSGYDPDRPEPYPVLYYADAWWLTELVVGMARAAYLSRGDAFDAPVLVGIGMDGDAEAWNLQRTLDLTPTPIRLRPGLTLRSGGVLLDSTTTGGAGAFLSFLREDLMPRIETDYAVDSERRGWLGHSFGGLFGAWSLVEDPDLFSDFLFVSPSVWWNDEEVTRSLRSASDARAFVAFGTVEFGPIPGTMPAFEDALDRAGASTQLSSYEGRDHTSVLMPAIWDGLLYLYGP